jgi:hypothetical protein
LLPSLTFHLRLFIMKRKISFLNSSFCGFVVKPDGLIGRTLFLVFARMLCLRVMIPDPQYIRGKSMPLALVCTYRSLPRGLEQVIMSLLLSAPGLNLKESLGHPGGRNHLIPEGDDVLDGLTIHQVPVPSTLTTASSVPTVWWRYWR